MTTTERKRVRLDSVTSHRFYKSEVVDQKLISLIESREHAPKENSKIKQSKHLPYWAWYVIAKITGVPLRATEKPVCGTLLHILTFTCAFVYATTYTWYIIYDILSPKTTRDIPGGTVGILLLYYWCGFGFYCKKLISRLFLHQRFLKDVRLHSRTIFKMNASLLALVLGALYAAANIYETITSYFYDKPCDKIELNALFCDIHAYSSIAFTIFTLMWHTLVSFIFMSVCRTHTIGLRCFTQELEHDAAIFQCQHAALYKTTFLKYANVWPDTTWETEEVDIPFAEQMQSPTSQKDGDGDNAGTSNQVFEQSDEIGILLSPVIDNLPDPDTISASTDMKNECPQPCQLRNMASGSNASSEFPSTMSSTEILHNFWRINRRLRFSSSALQRWFASFLALVLLRCSTYLVFWLRHVASIFDVIQFILPLVLLVVLSSALAEVNFEGQRFFRCLYPTEERLKMLQFLSQNPLQMPIYGFGMTHGTIVTVIFAILVGFVTRIVITEITK